MSTSLYVYERTVNGGSVEKVDTCEVGSLAIWDDLNAYAEEEYARLNIMQKPICLCAKNNPMSYRFPAHIDKIHRDVLRYLATCSVNIQEWRHYETSLLCANNQTVLFPPNLPGFVAKCALIPIHQPNEMQVHPAINGTIYPVELYHCFLIPAIQDACCTFPSLTESAIYIQISWLERRLPMNVVNLDKYHWMWNMSWMLPTAGWNVRVLDLSNMLYFHTAALGKHVIMFLKEFNERKQRSSLQRYQQIGQGTIALLYDEGKLNLPYCSAVQAEACLLVQKTYLLGIIIKKAEKGGQIRVNNRLFNLSEGESFFIDANVPNKGIERVGCMDYAVVFYTFVSIPMDELHLIVELDGSTE